MAYNDSEWEPWKDPDAPSQPFDPGTYTPPSPRYDYNAGSPPDQPLSSTEHGWVWEGPQTATWNTELGQWDRGQWQERKGEGLGYNPTPTPTTPGPSGPAPPGPRTTGQVPSIPGGGINVPSSTLPGDIQGLFNRPSTQTPVQGAYQDALLKFMGRSQETPSLSDPTLAPQVEVFRAQQQRNQERNRRAAAERAAATGQGQSGYLDNLIMRGVQEEGSNKANFNANLLGGEMNKRRQELQAALQLASATGNQEAQRELQEKLAQVSAMMQQQGLNLQGQLGQGDLALRLQQTLMGNDQFYDQLGVNSALNMEGLNQRALQLLMGGG